MKSNKLGLVCALLSAVFGGGRTDAAQFFTETFAGGLNGWTNGNDATKWTVTNQSVSVSFAGNFLPQTASIEGGIGASGGNFSGDCSAAGIEAIGFSFIADNVLPSVLKLELTGGTNVFFQDLRPSMTSVGVTNHFLVSLAVRDASRWSGAPSIEFPNTLTNITRVAIRVTTSGPGAQTCRADDIFFDRLPGIIALLSSGTNTTLSSGFLRTNFTYAVETSDGLTNTWGTALQFVATSRVATMTVTNTAPPVFFRLKN